MNTSALEQEIIALRHEVALLKQAKQTTSKKASKKTSAPKTTALPLDKEIKHVLTQLITQLKKEYETLSPASTLFLFTLGVLLGRALAQHQTKGHRS